MARERSHYALSREARLRSVKIWAVFLVLVLALSAVIGVAAMIGVQWWLLDQTTTMPPEDEVRELRIRAFAIGMAATMAVVFLTAGWKAWGMRGDGADLARSMGGEEITAETKDPRFRRVYNLVEEVSLAATTPMPRVFVLRHETGINAFAAGSGPGNAVVAVTHGAVSCFDRDELAGVIAHELAHIRNRDVVLNIRALAMIHGLMALSVIGTTVLRGAIYGRAFGRSNRNSDARAMFAMVAIGLTLIVVGFLGSLSGRILQSALSRQREYLADASAVSYTGNPGALASALAKIRGVQAGEGNGINAAVSQEAQHMLFTPSSRHLVSQLFATHPPVSRRIHRLAPDFDLERMARQHREKRQMAREVRDRERAQMQGPWERDGVARSAPDLSDVFNQKPDHAQY